MENIIVENFDYWHTEVRRGISRKNTSKIVQSEVLRKFERISDLEIDVTSVLPGITERWKRGNMEISRHFWLDTRNL